MSTPNENEFGEPVKVWPSIDNVKPEEEGGPTARIGFNYQDEIAAGFLIDMLERPNVLKVHCETHDDIVLVHQAEAKDERIAEYVQVKASEQDKLWSVADLCQQRKKSKQGSSIFETSLARDRHNETSCFRLVTLRPVVSDLKPLTYKLTAPSRAPESEGMKALVTELQTRFPGLASPKGNGAMFWLSNCLWDERHSEQAVRKDNLVRLMELSVRENRPLLPEPAALLLDELRAMAKKAGDLRWDPDRDQKILCRGALRAWWEQRTTELLTGTSAKSGGKLAHKMKDAKLPDELVGLAVEVRRGYAAEARTSRYLEPDDMERLQRRVQSEVISLQARFIAGQLDVDGAGFHALCLDRMDAVNAERNPGVEDRSAFLKGCMYDIADRCLLRFDKRSST
jgi:hypothetical protein